MRNRRLDQLQATLDEVATIANRVEVALVVRDPGTARSIEAYEGLRKAVTSAMRERRQHLIQLVQISESLDRGATPESLRDLTNEWCSLAGLVRWDDTSQPDYFQVLEGEGSVLEPISPAWVDTSDPSAPVLIQPGTARRRAPEPVEDLSATTNSPDGNAHPGGLQAPPNEPAGSLGARGPEQPTATTAADTEDEA